MSGIAAGQWHARVDAVDACGGEMRGRRFMAASGAYAQCSMRRSGSWVVLVSWRCGG